MSFGFFFKVFLNTLGNNRKFVSVDCCSIPSLIFSHLAFQRKIPSKYHTKRHSVSHLLLMIGRKGTISL